MPKSLFPLADPETRARLEQQDAVRLINEFDWNSTPLGVIPEWPASLKGAVRVLVSSSTPMVMLVGRQGILIYNEGYAKFAGRRHPEIFGKPATEAWPEIADFNRHKLEIGFAGQSLLLHDQELVLDRHGQPEPAWMDLHYSPVLGEDGVPQAVLCIVHETTDRVIAEQALARSEERLSLALSGTNLVGTWDWDVENDIITADDRFAELFGVDSLRAGLGLPLEQFIKAFHPEDTRRVQDEIAAAVETGGPFRSEYRVINSNGETRWIMASGRPRRDKDGRAVRFPGVVVDITEQKAVAAALTESEAQFRTLADTMPQMVWSTLPTGQPDYYNARWYDFTGLPRGVIGTEGWNDLLHPEDSARARQAWERSLESGEPYQCEYRLRHHSGQFRWTLGRALPVRDAEGEILRWIGTSTDIHDSRLAADERELVAQELSHRIKNIFAVLTGIIGLSARNQPDVKPFADQLRQRIHALGEAHDVVRPHSKDSPTAPTRSSLEPLVRRLMQPYETDGRSRLQFSGADAEVDDGAATPLALLIHELATNSAKYGALSANDGFIVLLGEEDEEIYRLVWKEKDGPPPPEGARKEGFGSRLMALSIEGQLGGRIERFWEPDGLKVIAELPKSALRRSARLTQTA